MKKALFILISLSIIFSSCSKKRRITLATSLTGSTWHKNGELISEAMKKYGWELEVLHGPAYANDGKELIIDKSVDFAIVPNNKTTNQGPSRAVVPLNQEALLVLYKEDGQNYSSIKELIRGKKILLPVTNSDAMSLIHEIFNTQDIKHSIYTEYQMNLENLDLLSDGWKSELDSIDVLITLTQLNNPLTKEVLELGWRIMKIGDLTNKDQGSIIDAYCFKYPWAFPVVVPINVFGQYQPEPVYTIGLRSLIIAHKDLGEDLVYDFVKDFYAAVPSISQKDVSFALVQDNYNRSTIGYPLHEGTINYLDRDQPLFVERYAEVIALIVTLSVLFAGLANRYLKKINQKKKDRIDVYYDLVLAAKDVTDLENIRLKAINQMQEENLLADETFVIFLQLYQQRKEELYSK